MPQSNAKHFNIRAVGHRDASFTSGDLHVAADGLIVAASSLAQATRGRG